jgi:aryl-alcohol dehydrogenase-like predicted oxidoreductase
MEYKKLGRTDLAVSRIGLGAQGFVEGGRQVPPEEAELTVHRAVDAGINFFDAAIGDDEGRVEKVIGKALRAELTGDRERVVIATHGGARSRGSDLHVDGSREALRRHLEQSLRNLGIDYVDLYVLHCPDPNTPLEETAAAFAELAAEGKLRYAGVRRLTIPLMEEFSRAAKIDVYQGPFSMFERDLEAEIFPFCGERGIGVCTHASLAYGLLTGSIAEDEEFPDEDWRSGHESFRGEALEANVKVAKRLQYIANNRGESLPELAIAWALHNEYVDAVVLGARNAYQVIGTAGDVSPYTSSAIMHNPSAADFHLSAGDAEEIEKVLADAVPIKVGSVSTD